MLVCLTARREKHLCGNSAANYTDHIREQGNCCVWRWEEARGVVSTGGLLEEVLRLCNQARRVQMALDSERGSRWQNRAQGSRAQPATAFSHTQPTARICILVKNKTSRQFHNT